MDNNPSLSIFMRTIYTTLVFATLFYGVLTVERIVRHVGFSDPYHVPTAPYVAVLNQGIGASPLLAGFMVHMAEDITTFWRFGN